MYCPFSQKEDLSTDARGKNSQQQKFNYQPQKAAVAKTSQERETDAALNQIIDKVGFYDAISHSADGLWDGLQACRVEPCASAEPDQIFHHSHIQNMNPTELIKHRSSLLIFRDCLKLASQMVTNDPVKVRAIRKLLKDEFVKNREVVDEEEVRALKMNAVRGISNYIIYVVKKQYAAEKQKTIYDKDEDEPQGEGHSR